MSPLNVREPLRSSDQRIDLGDEYQSPWWLPGGHLQTVWRKFGAQPPLSRRRQRIELNDGDFIDVDIAEPQPGTVGRYAGDLPLVLLLHGLAGCSGSPYILAMQALLQQQGIRSVAMNLRGCSGEFNRLPQAYHSGCSDDVEQVVTTLLDHENNDCRICVIGYSLGANVLIKWASETPLASRLQGMVSVSNPFSLDTCCRRMDSGLASLYGRYFLRRLRRDLIAKYEHFKAQGYHEHTAQIDALGDLSQLTTLREFDDAVTAPLHGFDGAEDYYARCSSRQFLTRIKAPVLLVHGLNDPIIPPQALPDPHELPVGAMWDLHPAGGHVGFAVNRQKDWLERRVLRFIELT
ncbi:YheT family hydrolase [Pseudohongiella sp. O18]|uniref:YheT family hydrolase n=1 Tax=Pseudohongiella sp. O18 TaxID=2904248 RepID=UPI001F40E7FD|nr:alpha/beta fold hydrolase [Pseudohongiella sp. O18]